MATTSKVNLIKEFSENQKGNDIIVLTTFNFDAPFFDVYLINRILDGNPSAEIFVLMDGQEYSRGYESFTKHTGRAYHLIPVYCNKGVFHPKLSIFYSTDESKITAYIGSCNVTLAGFTSNAEIVTKIESVINPIDSTVQEAVQYYKQLLEKKIIVSSKFSKAIDEIQNSLKNPKINNDVSLIHNLERPILDQVIEEIEEPEEATMLAPFWSPNPTVIEGINKNNKLKKLNILIQENNHNLSNPKVYQTYCNQNKINLKFYNAKFEKSRIFHSKILQMESKNPAALFGSSNMTESALLKNASNGNFEVAALIKNNVKDIIKEIKTEEIKDINSIKSQIIEYASAGTKDLIKILSVDFDMINQNLSILFHKDSIEKEITIMFEDKAKETHKLKDQEEFTIHCNKIPFEIIVKQEGITTRRRVFYDSNYFYKKISKGNISLTDINRKIAKDYKINAMDLLRVLSGINITIEKHRDQENRSETKTSGEGGKKFSLPSREIDSYHNKRMINSFVDLYKLMNSKREEEREIQESGELDETEQPKISVRVQRILDEDEEKRKICLKILDSINDLLIFKASLNEDPELEIVSSTPLMIQSIIKILSPIYMDNDLLTTFKDYVNDNLGKIDMNSMDIEVRKTLFNNLVLMNHYFNNWVHYNFLSELLKITDVMQPKFIQDCLEQVKGHTLELNPEECDDTEIMEHIGFLASYIPDSTTMEEDIIKSLKLIQKLSKDTEWELAKAYLKNIIGMWSISEDLKEQIYETIKGYSKEKKEFIEELLKDK